MSEVLIFVFGVYTGAFVFAIGMLFYKDFCTTRD